MGCSSSSMAQYPGNRMPAQAPHQPAANEYNKDGQAMSHFVSYGGGNALVLQQGGPQVGAVPVGHAKPNNSPEYVQVTLPPGVEPGQTIQVQAPSGRLNEIVVPPGMGPGSCFTVEFAEAEENKTYGGSTTAYASNNQTTSYTPPGAVPTTTAIPANDTVRPVSLPNGQEHDDGFATGFNNNNNNNNASFVPTSAAATNDYSSYPSANDARPVYNAPPAYSTTTY
ncbi:unnamed protein product [Cylindrotheca closterium]|uniref:Uncharacterized protein n=1 Tax=Cylindrotheca closterium TaxID=2856 RepID=A0AAD2JJ25_9STRA|nr:unnamed protein product [Cylindrotheca closterium]